MIYQILTGVIIRYYYVIMLNGNESILSLDIYFCIVYLAL